MRQGRRSQRKGRRLSLPVVGGAKNHWVRHPPPKVIPSRRLGQQCPPFQCICVGDSFALKGRSKVNKTHPTQSPRSVGANMAKTNEPGVRWEVVTLGPGQTVSFFFSGALRPSKFSSCLRLQAASKKKGTEMDYGAQIWAATQCVLSCLFLGFFTVSVMVGPV